MGLKLSKSYLKYLRNNFGFTHLNENYFENSHLESFLYLNFLLNEEFSSFEMAIASKKFYDKRIDAPIIDIERDFPNSLDSIKQTQVDSLNNYFNDFNVNFKSPISLVRYRPSTKINTLYNDSITILNNYNILYLE